VAGGAGGTGPAVVGALAAAGWDVVVTSRSGAEVEGARTVRADVTDPGEAERAVAQAAGLAAVVNLVGGFAAGPLAHEVPAETFRAMLDAHLMTNFNLARAAVPALLERGGGAFVAFSARAAERPFRGGAAYSTAQAATLAWVRALDADLRAGGLSANAVLPGTIDTPANREAMPDSDRSGWTSAEDIAALVRFLLSPEGRAVRGAAIAV